MSLFRSNAHPKRTSLRAIRENTPVEPLLPEETPSAMPEEEKPAMGSSASIDSIATAGSEIIEFNLDSLDADTILDTYRALTHEESKSALDIIYESFCSHTPLWKAYHRFSDMPEGKVVWLKDMSFFEGRDVWFIGDLHGDILGLEASLCFAKAQSESRGKRPLLFFLGDIIDGDAYNIEIILRLLLLRSMSDLDIVVLAGNHDEGFMMDGRGISSTVRPSQLADLLQSEIHKRELSRSLGMLTLQLFSSAPRAVFFPDGLMAAHGGFPLADLWEDIVKPADFEKPPCLQDFVWTRSHDNLPKKRPNRYAKDCQFGYEDFENFCKKAESVLCHPVKRLIRGHDHVDGRCSFSKAKPPHSLITINTLSHRLSREALSYFISAPCLALYRKERAPQIFRIHIPDSVVRGIFPIDQTNRNTTGVDLDRS